MITNNRDIPQIDIIEVARIMAILILSVNISHQVSMNHLITKVNMGSIEVIDIDILYAC